MAVHDVVMGHCRGNSHSLRPQQIVYVLPGKDYTTEDMEAIVQQASETAAVPNLMEDAWEVNPTLLLFASLLGQGLAEYILPCTA